MNFGSVPRRPATDVVPPRLQGDEGAVLVEFALVLPFLMLMFTGTMEFGFGWKQQIGLKNATRAGARQISNLGDDRTADFFGLQSIKSGLGAMERSTVQFVSVYKSTNANGDPSNASCIPATTPASGTGVSGACNIYVKSQIDALPSSFSPQPTQFGGTATTCSGTAWDNYWCPTGRNSDQGDAGGLDYVGVHIRVNYATVTKLVGSTITFNDRIVMRMEPRI